MDDSRERFGRFIGALTRALVDLSEVVPVEDLEIGVRADASTSWLLDGARYAQSSDEHQPDHRLQSGDVRIRFVRGVPMISIGVGRVRVDVVPRR